MKPYSKFNLYQMAPQKATSFLKEFVGFIKKFGVVGLALGVVIGGAVKTLTDSLVANVINPLLAKIVGKADLSGWVVWDIKIGNFVNDIINFIILMLVVYLAIRVFIFQLLTDEEKKNLKIDELEKKAGDKETLDKS
jgi:large conductance mechanosensitive channel protein